MSLIAAALILETAAETIVITGRGLPDEAPGEHRIVLNKDELPQSASGRMEDLSLIHI